MSSAIPLRPPSRPADGNSNSGGDDVFVAKFNSAGALQYMTFLGGTGTDVGNGIAVDSSGQAYVVGSTQSSSWGTAFSGARTSLSTTQDSFLVKLNAAGSSVLYSTYGIESGVADSYNSIAVDNSGHAYVTGTAGTAATNDIAVAKYNTATTGTGSLMLSKSISSSSINIGYGIAIDASRQRSLSR